jgi:hypothetical protein
MKWTALLILGIAGCSVPPQRRLSERGSEFQFMISAENRSVSTWTLRLDPPRLAGREEGVLTPKGPAGTELERIFARKFPAGTCRVEIRYNGDEVVIQPLPAAVDDDVYLTGRVSGHRVDGFIVFASEGGKRNLARFGGFLDRPK